MPATVSTPSKPRSKAAIIAALVEASGVAKKDVQAVVAALGDAIKGDLKGKAAPGVFNLFGLVKIKVVHKPATPARDGIDPFTKQPKHYPAKPARKSVKAVALKPLKDLVNPS